MTNVSKTTVTFTVLHRTNDPLLSGDKSIGEYNHAYDGLLGYLMSQAWDGGMVGVESDSVTVEVPDKDVAFELSQMGNDGTFFDEETP